MTDEQMNQLAEKIDAYKAKFMEELSDTIVEKLEHQMLDLIDQMDRDFFGPLIQEMQNIANKY